MAYGLKPSSCDPLRRTKDPWENYRSSGAIELLKCVCIYLKGNTTAIFKKEHVGKYVNPDITNILFLLYDIVNYQNQLVMFTSVGIHFLCETTDQTQ